MTRSLSVFLVLGISLLAQPHVGAIEILAGLND